MVSYGEIAARFAGSWLSPVAYNVPTMNKTVFGKTGFQVTPLGFGAGPIGYLKIDQDRIATILNTLLDAGVNVIDTAASYPGSEEAIGNSVSHRRGNFVLISKCGQSFPDVPGDAWSPQVITGTIDRALLRLKTDHLDVMLLHSCDLATLKKGDAIAALAKARDAGKIRFAGYSGDNEAAAYAAGHADIAVIETSINLADQMNIDTVLPVARKNNLGVIAKRAHRQRRLETAQRAARHVWQLRQRISQSSQADEARPRQPGH